MNLSRRNFLLGSAAAVTAAAAPRVLAVAEAAPKMFDGFVGEFNGIIIREVDTLSIDAIIKAKALAMAARPRITPLIMPDGERYYYMVTRHPSQAAALQEEIPRWA